MPELRTPRLLLRAYSPDDPADVDFALDMHSRWEVRRYIGREPRVLTDRVEAEEMLAGYARLEGPVHGVWLIADRGTGERRGTALLKSLPATADTEPLPPSGETEIGWHLHPDAWGWGIATEAAARVLRHAFDADLDTVLAVTHPDNTASQAVARRIGMEDRGLTDAYYATTCALFRADRPADRPASRPAAR